MTTRLIVNADDFGLTPGVNRAIAELHQQGVLTSATLMAGAMASAEAVAMARAMPSLGVGCHVVLVDGEPVLPAGKDLPRLTRRGRFPAALSQFLLRIHTGRAAAIEREIEAEARAQMELLLSRGVRLTHVDTHKHTHMFPRVLRPVLRAAKSCGICAVRNPFEPAWSVGIDRSAPILRRMQVNLLRRLEKRFLHIVAEEGFATTQGAIGVVATGTLNADSIRSLVHALPKDGRAYELVTHPGYNDADLKRANTRLLDSRDVERQGLMALRGTGEVELISFERLREALKV